MLYFNRIQWLSWSTALDIPQIFELTIITSYRIIIQHIFAYHHGYAACNYYRIHYHCRLIAAEKSSPGFAGLRGFDRVNSQFVCDIPQFLNGFRFRFMIIRHFFIVFATSTKRFFDDFHKMQRTCANKRATSRFARAERDSSVTTVAVSTIE